MTERTPPNWLQSGTYPAEDDRRLIHALTEGQQGVLGSGDLLVTQRGAGANMSVDVATGRCIVVGDLNTYEGSYFCDNRGTTNVAVAASDPTNGRLDRVVAEVLNQEYSGVSNLWRLRVITGTPSGSPVLPAEPSNCLTLATIGVAAATSSVVNANITDVRPRALAASGVGVAPTSASLPVGPTEGMVRYVADLDQVMVYSGSAWVPIGQIGSWTNHTPTVAQGATSNIAKTVNYSRYIKLGRSVWWNFIITATASGTGGAALTLSLPFTSAVALNMPAGSGYIFNGGNVLGEWSFNATGTIALVLAAGGFYTTQVLNTHTFTGHIAYEATS